MTFVGHSLMGATLAQVALPIGATWKRWFLVVNVYALLAFFPDLPLPGWGHSAYFFSHSLFVNLLLIIPLTVAGCIGRAPAPLNTRPLVLGAAAVWLSHFPLDALYNHGQGVAIYWPFSSATLNLALPWFETLNMRAPLTAAPNARVFLIEAMIYLPLFLLVAGGRHAWHHLRLPTGSE